MEAGQALADLPAAALRPAWKAARDWTWIACRRTDAINEGTSLRTDVWD